MESAEKLKREGKIGYLSRAVGHSVEQLNSINLPEERLNAMFKKVAEDERMASCFDNVVQAGLVSVFIALSVVETPAVAFGITALLVFGVILPAVSMYATKRNHGAVGAEIGDELRRREQPTNG